ncbi:MAG: hypothetical protein K6E78_10685 [Treponema sp.]|nr:hypothetical protein [Treponema sp.]
MKKNISRFLMGAVAGLASLVLAACSGDLHQPLERPVVPGSTGAYTPSLEDANEVSIFFKTTEDRDYFFWAWNSVGGGELFTVAGTWPGDAFVLKGTDSDGKYIYKYTITTTTELPDNFIISYDGGGSKVYDGAAFVKNGLFVEGSEEAEVITAIAAPAPETPAGNDGNEGEGSEGGNNTPAAPVEITLDSTFVAKGDFGEDIAIAEDGEGTGVFAFTLNYRTTMTAWGGSNGNLNLKLNSGDTWYGVAKVNAEASTSLPEGVSISGTDNIIIGPLTDLTTYKISFKLTDDKTALVISVAATGTFDAPAGPTDYASIEAAETAGELPNADFTLDETTGGLFTVTGVPGWYGDANAAIWGVIKTDDNSQYWKRLKYVKNDGALYFTTNLNVVSIKIRRYNPSDLTDMWNSSGGALTITNNTAVYPAQ